MSFSLQGFREPTIKKKYRPSLTTPKEKSKRTKGGKGDIREHWAHLHSRGQLVSLRTTRGTNMGQGKRPERTRKGRKSGVSTVDYWQSEKIQARTKKRFCHLSSGPRWRQRGRPHSTEPGPAVMRGLKRKSNFLKTT